MKVDNRIKTPFELEAKLLDWFDFNKRNAFLTAIITGIILHFTAIGNQLLSGDGLMFSIRYRAGEGALTMGRWGLVLLSLFWPDRETHAIIVPICILFAAICAIFVIDILSVKSKVVSFLIGIAFVCAPAFTAWLYYSYIVTKSCFAMLVILIAVWLVVKMKKWYKVVFAALLVMFSLSIYQGFIGLFTGLAVILTIKGLLDVKNDKEQRVATLKMFGQFVASAAIGMVLYIISLKIMEKVCDVVVTYGGASSFTLGYVIKNIFSSLGKTYRDFFAYFLQDNIVKNIAWQRDDMFKALCVVVLINIALLMVQCIKEKYYISCGIVAVLTLLFPLAVNSVEIITMGNTIYQLTSMPMILVFIFALTIAEMTDFKSLTKLVPWVEMALVCAILITYMYATVFSHVFMKMQYDHMITVANRAIERVETVEGYEPGMRFVFLGVPDKELYSFDDSYSEYDLGGIVDVGFFHEGLWAAVYQSWSKILIKYHGTTYPYADINTAAAIYGSPEFQEMECFPDKDSVQIINDVVVVKFSL